MNTVYASKTLTGVQLAQLCLELKQALTLLYGNRLDRVVLYGSYVRGDFRPDSDVDFLVVLRDEVVHAGQEVWFMGDSVGELSYRHDIFISVKPTSSFKFDHADTPFYTVARNQGKQL